jgi:hypothetical protein
MHAQHTFALVIDFLDNVLLGPNFVNRDVELQVVLFFDSDLFVFFSNLSLQKASKHQIIRFHYFRNPNQHCIFQIIAIKLLITPIHAV